MGLTAPLCGTIQPILVQSAFTPAIGAPICDITRKIGAWHLAAQVIVPYSELTNFSIGSSIDPP